VSRFTPFDTPDNRICSNPPDREVEDGWMLVHRSAKEIERPWEKAFNRRLYQPRPEPEPSLRRTMALTALASGTRKANSRAA